MKSVKLTLFGLTLAAIAALGFSLIAASPVLADAKSDVCAGIGIASGSEGCEPAPNDPSVNSVIEDVINILSIVVGAAAVIMIIIGGFRFVTSGGDSGATTSARNTILYAIVGLVVVALAQIIVRFVLDQFI